MTAMRSPSGSSNRSRPSTCNRSKQNSDSGVRTCPASVSSLVMVREAITWKVSGRPSSPTASTSPSSTSRRDGNAATAATISGTRAVMSSKLRE
jgi:hypothetical protein